MPPEDRTRILHMIEAADAVSQFIVGRRRDDLDSDRVLLFALTRALEVFGEAAGKASPPTKAAAPEIPWPEIVAMRNRLVHAYFDIDPNIVGKLRPRKFPRCFLSYENWFTIDDDPGSDLGPADSNERPTPSRRRAQCGRDDVPGRTVSGFAAAPRAARAA